MLEISKWKLWAFMMCGVTALICALLPCGAFPQQMPEEGVCARVRVQLSQSAVITRTTFRATLEITNSPENVRLEQFKVTLDIRNADDQQSNDLFVISPPDLTGIGDVTGTGSIDPGATAKAVWSIIPTRDAALNGATEYTVGATMEYMQGDVHLVIPLYPAPISVRPDPFLRLDYFLVRDVYSNDPFTPEVEPAEPFPMGLLLVNGGKGEANNVQITSSQPQIVDNEKGLLIEFKIIHTQVNDNTISPSLTVDLGNVGPDQTAVALWMMTCSLQGKFIEYKATFEHIDGLGDPRVSLIDSVNMHELAHAVRVDVPSDDGKPDFLANDIPDEATNPQHLPNTLYNSDGTTDPVEPVINGAVVGSPSPISLTAQLVAPPTSGWAYYRVNDPGGDWFRLVRVTRSDGREIRMGDNAWATHRTIRLKGQAPYREHFVHIFDKDSTGVYDLVYELAPKPCYSLSKAKLASDDYAVDLLGEDAGGVVTTAVFPDCLYVESQDRSSGIRVTGLSGFDRGTKLRVKGTLGTSEDRERYVASLNDSDHVQVMDLGPIVIDPLGLSNWYLGGGDWLYDPLTGAGQCGVNGGFGLNNIGLLVRVWGRVTTKGDGFLYIDDGSSRKDGTLTGAEENVGVRVVCDSSGYSRGDYLLVIGISSCFVTPTGAVAPRLLPRDLDDIQVVESGGHTVSGRVILQDYNGSVASQSVQVELRKQGGGSETRTVSLDSTGNYSLQNVSPGVYDLAFKGLHWLRETTTVDVTSDLAGVDLSLINGDVDGSNVIGPGDLAILRSKWGTADSAADLDGSGTVGPGDLTILRNNWGKQGDP